jgi:alpha-L-arabinofuranosidase
VRVSIKVPDGQTLLVDGLSNDSAATPGTGAWQTTNGVLHQSDQHGNTGRFAGDPSWTNYTLSLKARKIAGDGSLVITVYDDGKGARAQWILGGWENKQHGIMTHYAEQDQLLDRVPGSLEDNQWYDVKITVNGDQMDCYLDNKLIQSAHVLHLHVPTLFTSAVRDESTGETILKVVNAENQPAEASIDLQGAAELQPTAQATVLMGRPADENSFENPGCVAPATTQITGVQRQFSHTFPPHSFTVLRIGTARGGQ